tara:strand:- start:456 stop:1277 length:822 start_codon:yes stop_codon:yes gene_type:complete
LLINSKFYLRLLTGLFGSGLLLISILNPWTYFVIFLVILISCLKEYYFILRDNGFRPFSFLGFIIGSYLFTLSFLVSAKLIPSTYYISLLTIFPIICIVFLYIKNLSNSLINLSLSFAGIIYIALPFSILNLITFKTGYYSYDDLLLILIYTWVSESFAYIGGKKFGKRKLSYISPGKTWEGVFFGFVANIILSLFLSHYYNNPFIFYLIFGLIVLIIGIFGDLFESLIKRGFSLKDSGNKLPGHGGYLDRFDSLLFIIPFIYFYLLFIKHFI